MCQPLCSDKELWFHESLSRPPRSAVGEGCHMESVRWSPRRHTFSWYIFVLRLDHNHLYDEVSALAGACDEAAQACAGHSEASYESGTSWPNGDSPDLHRLYDPCHTFGWSGSDGKGMDPWPTRSGTHLGFTVSVIRWWAIHQRLLRSYLLDIIIRRSLLTRSMWESVPTHSRLCKTSTNYRWGVVLWWPTSILSQYVCEDLGVEAPNNRLQIVWRRRRRDMRRES